MTPNEEMENALTPILGSMRMSGVSEEEITAYRNGFTTGAMWRNTHPHWISVEEQDIPLGQWVITYAPNEINYCKIDVELLAMDETAEDFGITHWMPLPQAPSCPEFPNNHIIGANKKVDRVIGSAEHIKTALDVMKKGGEE